MQINCFFVFLSAVSFQFHNDQSPTKVRFGYNIFNSGSTLGKVWAFLSYGVEVLITLKAEFLSMINRVLFQPFIVILLLA